MAVRRPLVVVAGQVQELPAGDSVPDLDLKADLTGAAFTGGVSIATSGTPSSLSITKNTNPTLTPLGDDGNIATLTGKDGKAARFIFDAYGGNANAMYRRANGTAVAPTGLLASEYIGNISFFGHDGVTHLTVANANIVGYATETWTPTARGCAIRFKTTANGVGGSAVDRYNLTHTDFSGYTDDSVSLGSATYRWSNLHTTGITIYGGTPGVGKVLTSDADGVGTWQTPTGGAGVTWKSTTLDLGTVPIYSKSVTFADAAATTTSKINIVHAPTNDEAEMDAVIAAAVCLTNGTITVYVHAIPGPVTGSKNFNYFLG